MSDTAKVVYEVEFDLNSVEDHPIEWWGAQLRIEFEDSDKPTWSEVYAELARVVIGSTHYQRYCITAIEDVRRFQSYAKAIRTTSKRHPVVVPPPPKPRKTSTKVTDGAE